MYGRLPSFVLGFHGCEYTTAVAAISRKKPLQSSQNPFDWLGKGIYFWEHDATRALEFARNKAHRKIKKPAVLGAIIDLANCLNLLDTKFLPTLRDGYEVLKEKVLQAGQEMPANRVLKGNDVLLHDLDCAVIEIVHALRAEQQLPQFDTVRSAFIEGAESYPGSAFREKNHIQICVRNPKCIKGGFWPAEDADDSMNSPAL